jgi:hypothetical protein
MHAFEECAFRKCPFVTVSHGTLSDDARIILPPAYDVEYLFGVHASALVSCPLSQFLRPGSVHCVADDLPVSGVAPRRLSTDSQQLTSHNDDNDYDNDDDDDEELTVYHVVRRGHVALTVSCCVHVMPLSSLVDAPSNATVYVWFLCDISRLYHSVALPVHEEATDGICFADAVEHHYLTALQHAWLSPSPPDKHATWFAVSLSAYGTVDEVYPKKFLGHTAGQLIDKPLFRHMYCDDVPNVCRQLATGAPRGMLRLRVRFADARLSTVFRDAMLEGSDTLGDPAVKEQAVCDALERYADVNALTLDADAMQVYRPVEWLLFRHDESSYDRPTYLCLARALPLPRSTRRSSASTLSASSSSSVGISRVLSALRDAMSSVVLQAPLATDSPRVSPLITPSSSIPGASHRPDPTLHIVDARPVPNDGLLDDCNSAVALVDKTTERDMASTSWLTRGRSPSVS